MKLYQIINTGRRHFECIENDKELGTLIFESHWNFNSSVALTGKTEYRIQKKGFWHNEFLLKNGVDIISKYRFVCKGMLLEIGNKESDKFLIKAPVFLGKYYTIINKANELFARIEVKYSWRRMRYEYFLESTDQFEKWPNKEANILFIVHAINYRIALNAAAAAA